MKTIKYTYYAYKLFRILKKNKLKYLKYLWKEYNYEEKHRMKLYIELKIRYKQKEDEQFDKLKYLLWMKWKTRNYCLPMVGRAIVWEHFTEYGAVRITHYSYCWRNYLLQLMLAPHSQKNMLWAFVLMITIFEFVIYLLDKLGDFILVLCLFIL